MARLAMRRAFRTLLVTLLITPLLAGLLPAQEAPGPGEPSVAERRAIGYIHTLVTAEREYRKKHGKYATSLAGLVGKGSFTRRMATTDRGDYTVHFSAKEHGYAVSLTPKTFDAEHRAFFADENGLIRFETDKPATAQSPILRESH